jgi:hypothetical protein
VDDRNVLLVEGKDDVHVFWHLLEYYHIPDAFRIKNKEGIDKLRGTLEVELLASGLQRLGMVIDADTNLGSRWQSLRNILLHSGYHIPVSPDPTGTVIEQPGSPKVGIWVMPDNTAQDGFLETFVSFLVPANDPLWSRACGCVRRIPATLRRFPSEHRIKACLYTWLAWQKTPGTPMGSAINECYLDPNAPQAHLFIAWIRHLFDIQEQP